tara:strand:- start:1978 stop:2196 length:219 start_codon:yes stop_codon:yes gene_type:complete
MIKFITGFLLFLVVAPMLGGCAAWEEKVMEMKLSLVPMANDKELLLDSYPCPGCFHLGPLDYDDMIVALLDK